jgi:hypothetical protein
MSANKESLRSLFTRKGCGGKNALVFAEEWRGYSSTNSKFAAALFRVKNTTSDPIAWTAQFYATSYYAWSERASVAVNGQNVWNSGGANYSPKDKHVLSLVIPANRTSTVIFISASSPESTTRSTMLGFTGDCLALPAGLEFVDDLDTASGGWEQ